MELSDQQRVRLSGLLARGELVLFTGAGFAVGATDSSGRHLPSAKELSHELWQVAFPDTPFDDTSTLADVFECALKGARRATARLLRDRLAVHGSALPDYYQVWFSQPWLRMYTLNIDNLDEVAGVRFPLPRPISPVSSLTSAFPELRSALYSIHLNGTLNDVPDVTFSAPQYGTRLARPEPWYQTLVADITSRPVIFIGTELNESLLWQYMAMRSIRDANQREMRPGSYLVTPQIATARRSLLENYNISWIEASVEEFALELLIPLQQHSEAGLQRIAERAGQLDAPLLQPVAELRVAAQPDVLQDFLLGRAPIWDDVVNGYAVTRRFEEELPAKILAGESRITILTGTAGSGKSTSLMGLAVALQAEGQDVWWMDPFAWPSSTQVRTAIAEHPPQVLAIDDLNRLGGAAFEIMKATIDEHPDLVIIAAARSTRTEAAHLEQLKAEGKTETIEVPLLVDEDIDRLLESLDRANRLGVLKGKSLEARRSVLREECGRQLLVAMIEATSGERFDEIVCSECRDLSETSSYLYAVLALATHEGYWLSRDECLDSTGIVVNDALVALRRLTDSHLVLDDLGHYRVRHRVIAERAVSFYTDEGQIADPILGLAQAMAKRVYPSVDRRSRERLMLNRLINHEWLFRHVKMHGARRIYQGVEGSLDWDFQFWLQRGRSELEHGSLAHARNFLGQAVSLEPDNLWVRAAWSQLVIQDATRSADPAALLVQVGEAFSELEDIIQVAGHREVRYFHVLGLRGMLWVQRAALSDGDRIAVLLRLIKVVREGCQLHPDDSELEAVSNQLQREYLMTAVDENSRA